MKARSNLARQSLTHRDQRGVTLIELMISVAIGLLLVAIAGYVYVTVQSSTRNLEAQALRNETSQIFFDLIGKDLKYSGYYPAQFPGVTGTNVVTRGGRGQFNNIVNGALPAFSQGIFGCSNATFNLATGLCNAAVTDAPDSLVINYFVDDTFGANWQGLRRDCLRDTIEAADFSGLKYNETRAGGATATSTTTVALPLLVNNVYSLSGLETATYYFDQTIQTRSLRCNGNNPGSTDQPLVQGVEQLTVRYGVLNPDNGPTAEQFYTAQAVSNLPIRTIIKDTGNISLTGWQRVSSLEICVLTRTLDPSARQESSSKTYTDCANTVVTQTDRFIYKREARRFAVRNNIPVSYL